MGLNGQGQSMDNFPHESESIYVNYVGILVRSMRSLLLLTDCCLDDAWLKSA